MNVILFNMFNQYETGLCRRVTTVLRLCMESIYLNTTRRATAWLSKIAHIKITLYTRGPMILQTIQYVISTSTSAGTDSN